MVDPTTTDAAGAILWKRFEQQQQALREMSEESRSICCDFMFVSLQVILRAFCIGIISSKIILSKLIDRHYLVEIEHYNVLMHFTQKSVFIDAFCRNRSVL